MTDCRLGILTGISTMVPIRQCLTVMSGVETQMADPLAGVLFPYKVRGNQSEDDQ